MYKNIIKKKNIHLGYKWIGLLLFTIILFIYYYGIALKMNMNSDAASILLQAQEIANGNILLRDWFLSTGAYITTDLLFYAIAIKLFGFSSNVIYIVSALFYTLLVAVCVLFSLKRQKGISYLSAFYTFTLIGVPSFFLSSMIFTGPLHVSSLLYIITALFIWESAKNAYLKYGLLYFLVTLTLIADPFATWFFVLPFCLVCLYKLIVNRSELYSFVTIVAAYISSKLVLIAINFNIPSIGHVRFLEITEIKKNISLLVQGYLELYQANFFGEFVSPISTFILMISLSVLFFVGWIIFKSIRQFKVTEYTTFEMFLLCAIAINTLEYFLSNMPVDIWTTRYLVPSYIYIALYVGMYIPSRLPRNGLSKIVLSIMICYSLFSLQKIDFSKNNSVYIEVADLLSDIGAKNGYGAYWHSSIITMESKGDVKVRPVIFNESMTPYNWLSKSTWYDEESHFLIFDDTNWGNINLETATSTFGKPDEVYKVNNLNILYWKEDITIKLSKK
ncbi:hypothetical protein AB4Z17_32080 [Paenibacillus sp. TAF43_2]|uniref:hypothetical protein n=1 Tax=Paenibacillus sp. TAF43_2 TaxID=3233069 RepID=UPI003F9C0A7A